MKCKIFYGSDLPLLESKINDWLDSRSQFQINHVTQTHGAEQYLVISIFYESDNLRIPKITKGSFFDQDSHNRQKPPKMG